MKTIKELRQSGYKVRVNHQRNLKTVYTVSGEHNVVDARGGTTTIEITTPDKQQNVTGIAKCSNEDNFDHKVGNSIAIGRALKQLETI
jgi:hypothetical protein